MTSPTNYTGNDFGLLAGALRGYRVWQLKPDPSGTSGFGYHLYSLNNQRWESSELEAKCIKYGTTLGLPFPISNQVDPNHGEISPSKPCTCGIYACHDTGGDFAVLASDRSFALGAHVAGVVEGTGRVVVGERGFRSQRMRIVGLVRPKITAPVPYSVTNMQISSPSFFDHTIQVRVQIAVSDGSNLELRMMFSQEMLYYARAGVAGMQDLIDREVDRKMRDYLVGRFLPTTEQFLATLVATYRVQIFDSVDAMLKAFPPISVEHLLPKKRAPLIPAPYSAGFPITSGQWNIQLNAAQMQNLQGHFNMPGSIVNWSAYTQQMQAAATASAISMKELNDAINGLFKLPLRKLITEEAPAPEKPEKRKRTWLKKTRKRWRRK